MEEQKTIINKHDSLLNRKVNEIDMYQQTRDQDFLALSNCSKRDLGANQSKISLLDRLRRDEKRSPADIQSVLSTSLSRLAGKDKNVTFADIPPNIEKKTMVIDGVNYLKIKNTYRISLHKILPIMILY